MVLEKPRLQKPDGAFFCLELISNFRKQKARNFHPGLLYIELV